VTQESVVVQSERRHGPSETLPGRRDEKCAKNREGFVIPHNSGVNLGGPRARGPCYLPIQALRGVRSSVDRSSDNVRNEGRLAVTGTSAPA
jgi:hypothetical protein